MDYAVRLGSADTIIYKKNQGIVLNEPTLGSGTALIEGGRVTNLDGAKQFFTAAFKRVATPLTRSCVFCIPCSLSAEELSDYKSVAFASGIENSEFIPSVVANAIGGGFDPEGATACMSVEITESGTDIAVIKDCAILRGGTIDEGGNAAIAAVGTYLEQKHNMPIDFQVARHAYLETATLLLNDEVSCKIENIGYLDGIECYKAIYPIFTRLAKAILQILSECPEDIQANIKDGALFVGGSASNITGLREFLTSTLDINVTLAPEGINASINGAGKILANDSLIKQIVKAN